MTDLTMIRGDTAQFTTTATKDGVPLDLTDCEVTISARLKFSSPTAVFTLGNHDSLSGVTIPDQTDPDNTGTLYWDVPDTATEDLPARTTTLRWDCEVVEPDGTRSTVDRGELVVSPDVSHD